MWEDWYRRLICRIFEQLGGDCKDLSGKKSDEQAVIVEGAYRTEGAPTFPDPKDRDAFLADLAELGGGLSTAGSTLSQASIDLLKQMVIDLTEELKP